MNNLEIIKVLLNVMDCSSATDEGIRRVCLDLLEKEIGGGEAKAGRKAKGTKACSEEERSEAKTIRHRESPGMLPSWVVILEDC